MKIGIITFHASHNYGSMLQAYSLQTYLLQQGHEVSIINFRSDRQKKMYRKPFRPYYLKHPRLMLKIMLNLNDFFQKMSKWYKFEHFLRKFLHTTIEFPTVESLQKAKFDFDVIISGSDQIWNTKCYDFYEAYFIPFAKGTKKIAYAASMGPYPNLSEPGKFADYIAEYSAISLRERKSIPYIEKYSRVPISDCVDPTLLVDKQYFIPLFKHSPIERGKYILFYAPSLPHETNDTYLLANELGRRTGMRIIVTQDLVNTKRLPSEFKYKKDIGPSEFLNLINYAEFVCGYSFHMVVFSILMQKEFYTINAENDTRTNNILELLDFKNRNVTSHNIERFSRKPISYLGIEDKLSKVRYQSELFLKNNLKNNG